MSNSSRIEAATRGHIGAVLTNDMIVELVKLADPTNTKGVYPSDVAYKRTPEGLVPRGKTAYGDGVLEYLAENSFKVLPTAEIVRRKKSAAPAPAPVAATPAPAPAPASVGKAKAKKPTGKASQPPVIAKSKGADRHAAQ